MVDAVDVISPSESVSVTKVSDDVYTFNYVGDGSYHIEITMHYIDTSLSGGSYGESSTSSIIINKN